MMNDLMEGVHEKSACDHEVYDINKPQKPVTNY